MGDEMRAAKKRRIMNNIITITVGGDNGEEFMIHDFLLKENSKFFEAALDRQWKEGQEKKIALPDDDPEVFAVYAGWLFTGKIASKDEKPLDEFTRADVEHEHPLQAKLYVLGEKLIDDKFCDCALKAWAELCKTKLADGYCYMPSPRSVSTAYAGTTDTSPIRKFLADYFCSHGKKEVFSDAKEKYFPREFLVDLIRVQFSMRTACSTVLPENAVESYFKCK